MKEIVVFSDEGDCRILVKFRRG